MPVTHPPPNTVPGPKDDKTAAAIPSRSPPSVSPVADIRPIVPHQPSRESPSPPPKPESRPTTPQPSTPASRSTPQPEAPPQKDVKNGTAATVEEEEEAEEEADTKDAIDMETFQQILELDEEDDEDREFSRGMVWEYFSQAKKTFDDLDEALTNKDLSKLSHLGHFLKGSSAALGISRVETACEKIQHYGVLRDEEKDVDLSDKNALELIQKTLKRVKKDYAVAEKELRRIYEEGN